jgi:hypothetical protein
LIRTRLIRWTVIAVCVAGVVGMIVASATDHNGAALTFGLITAVAILCQMVATTVQNEMHAEDVEGADTDAEELEARITALVDSGVEESAVRDLVRRAVRFGRRSPPPGATDS